MLGCLQILTESMRSYLDSATEYVVQLDLTFANAGNIYEVKDEVVVEAKQKLHEIAQWSHSLIVRGSNTATANGPHQNNTSH